MNGIHFSMSINGLFPKFCSTESTGRITLYQKGVTSEKTLVEFSLEESLWKIPRNFYDATESSEQIVSTELYLPIDVKRHLYRLLDDIGNNKQGGWRELASKLGFDPDLQVLLTKLYINYLTHFHFSPLSDNSIVPLLHCSLNYGNQ
jgi:hypothetical protein